MTKNSKILLTVILVSLLLLLGTCTVSAQIISFYNVTLPTNSTWNGSWVTADRDYLYVVNNVVGTANGDNYDSYYQTDYYGSPVTIGAKITRPARGNSGTVGWSPNYTTPSSYNLVETGRCSGQNTTTNWCAVRNSVYRVHLENFSIAGGNASIDGQFILVEN